MPLADVQWDTSKSDGQFRKPASNAKLQKLIGGYEFVPFEVALKESVDWFLENYECVPLFRLSRRKLG